MVVGAATLEEVEVADLLVTNEMGTEQDDVLATCESWLAALGREVDLSNLTTFCGFELFGVKKEPRAGQNWGISEV